MVEAGLRKFRALLISGGVIFTFTPEQEPPELRHDVVRCIPSDYWDGIGEYRGNLWMLYRMTSGMAMASSTDEELLRRIQVELEK